MTFQIAVVGAGVIGCSVALRLCDVLKSKASVTVISEKFSPNTTSDAAGAIMVPFNVTSSGDVDDRTKRWVRESFQLFNQLYRSEDAGEADIQLVQGYYADEDEADDGVPTDPWWADLVLGFREVGLQERELVNIPTTIKKVFAFSTYIINGRSYLPWLMNKIKRQGGSFICQRVTDLSELKSYDIVVNCTGLGSYELVSDRSLYPVHGDAMLVSAPWVKQFYILTDNPNTTYIFPRSKSVLLGGTKRKDDWSVTVDEDSLKAIRKRCTELIPSLAHAQMIQTWAGLRPAREIIRLEEDPINRFIIHCYGHGGQGIMLSHGCALDVCQIISRRVATPKL